MRDVDLGYQNIRKGIAFYDMDRRYDLTVWRTVIFSVYYPK